jgi:glyoxylase-like metal-dependent hydrolase (beta-lactamase superfamily II)
MINAMNRRSCLTGLGAVAGLSVLPSGPLRADGMMPMRAIRQFALGDMNITVIDDGSFSMGVGMFGANAEKSDIGALMGKYGLSETMAEMPLQIMLIETEGVRVLVDTGMGDVTFHGNETDNGRLVESLATVGLVPNDIDILVLTHGHPDHVGGLTIQGDRVFKNALHLLPDIEFKFWTQDPDSAPAGLREMIRECSRHLLPVAHGMKSYSSGQEVAPGIFAVAAPGHTHGHFALRLESQGQSLLHLVDTAVHYITGLEKPDWTVGADLNKPLAVETRRRLLSQAADEQTLVAGYHFPFPGVGRILRMGDGFRFVPVPLV